MNRFPVAIAYAIKDEPEQPRWLIDQLWGDQAVGVLGGEPKCCKSFLALTLAVAVASGKPCLRRFSVPKPGTVLIFPAEDRLPVVKQRLDGICRTQDISLQKLPIYVITAPSLRIDLESDRTKLKHTIEKIKPSLLILDPFVRLHAGDENASGDVAKLLAHLRYLQRSYELAIALVHHARKGGAKRPGQALRGSSEFHAWGDSNLYLKRNKHEQLSLTIEHRAERSLEPFPILLDASSKYPHLRIQENLQSETAHTKALPPEQLIIDALANADTPIRSTQLRNTLPLRNTTVSRVLLKLQKAGSISKDKNGYFLIQNSNY